MMVHLQLPARTEDPAGGSQRERGNGEGRLVEREAFSPELDQCPGVIRQVGEIVPPPARLPGKLSRIRFEIARGGHPSVATDSATLRQKPSPFEASLELVVRPMVARVLRLANGGGT